MFQDLDLEFVATFDNDNCIRLDSIALERQLDELRGIKLATVGKDSLTSEDEYRALVPFFLHEGFPDTADNIRAGLEQVAIEDEPSALAVGSGEELEQHMLTMYTVAYHHYALAKHYDLRGMFPLFCCGLSSLSLTISMVQLGYNQSVLVRSAEEHGYVALPFTLEEDSITGCIVGDPTFDQYGGVRNHTVAFFGHDWKYVGGRRNFSPRIVKPLRFIRETPELTFEDDLGAQPKEYFLSAFANPTPLGRTVFSQNPNL